MKKIYLAILSLFISNLSLADTIFTTKEMASEYCPAETAILFTPNNINPTSAGVLSGSKNNKNFKSLKYVMRPINLSSDNIVQGIHFREDGGRYGYTSGNVVTCLYAYTGFSGATILPVMRSE